MKNLKKPRVLGNVSVVNKEQNISYTEARIRKLNRKHTHTHTHSSNMEDIDFTTLPLEQRLEHKLWKARVHGYEELGQSIKLLRNKPYTELLNFIQRYNVLNIVNESNVVALEKAVSVISSFLSVLQKGLVTQVQESYESVFRKRVMPIRNTLMSSVLLKCCNSSRQLTKQTSIDVVVLLCQLDYNIDYFVELMNSLLPSNLKNVKVLNGFVSAIPIVLLKFQQLPANKKLLEPFLINLLKLSTNADRKIRQESFYILAILDSLFGANKDFIQDIVYSNWKPVQLKEFDSKLATVQLVPSEKVQFEDTLIKIYNNEDRDVVDNQEAFEKDGDGDTIMNSTSSAKESTDPFDLYSATSILPELNMAHFEQMMKSKLWKDRVETLQDFHERVLKTVKKLDSSNENYTPIFTLLCQNVSKDSNLQAVQLSVQAIDKMMDCLKYQSVHTYSHLLFQPLIERLKEKKINTVVFETLLKLVEYNNTGLKFCLDELVNQYLKHKTLLTRSESCKLLNELMLKYPRDVRKLISLSRLTNEVLPPVLKICNDSQQAIRQIGFRNIAIFMELLDNGEEELTLILEKKLDQLKFKKILEIKNGLDVVRPKEVTRPVSEFPERNGSSLPLKRMANSPLRQPLKISNTLKKDTFATTTTTTQQFPPSSSSAASITTTNSSESASLPRKRSPSTESSNGEWQVEKKKLLNTIDVLMAENYQLKSNVQDYKLKASLLESELNNYKHISTTFETKLNQAKLQIQDLTNAQSHTRQDGPPTSSSAESPWNKPSSSSTSAVLEPAANTHSKTEPQQPNSPFLFVKNSSFNRTASLPVFSSEDLNKKVDSLKLHGSSASFQSVVTDESWKKAAQVTQDLRARIEKMRARTGNPGNPSK